MSAIFDGQAEMNGISSSLVVSRMRCADETDHSLSRWKFQVMRVGSTKLQVKEEVESLQVITAHELMKITRHKRHLICRYKVQSNTNQI
jgi:hypothetical protein